MSNRETVLDLDYRDPDRSLHLWCQHSCLVESILPIFDPQMLTYLPGHRLIDGVLQGELSLKTWLKFYPESLR
jgi:hypothetical protein